MTTTKAKLMDPIIWAKTQLGMRHAEVKTDRATCPHCGRLAWASYNDSCEYGRLRIHFSCQNERCRRTGSTVWHIVKAVTRAGDLDAAAAWLKAQGVEVTEELIATGAGVWETGRLGRNQLEAEERARKEQARRAAAERDRVENMAPEHKRIAELERRIAELEGART